MVSNFPRLQLGDEYSESITFCGGTTTTVSVAIAFDGILAKPPVGATVPCSTLPPPGTGGWGGGGQGGSRTEDEDFFPFFSRAPRIRGSWLLSPPSLKLQCNNSTLVVRFVYSEYGLCLVLVTVTHKRVDRLCARPVEPRARTESH